jgi:hypothetical protein
MNRHLTYIWEGAKDFGIVIAFLSILGAAVVVPAALLMYHHYVYASIILGLETIGVFWLVGRTGFC